MPAHRRRRPVDGRGARTTLLRGLVLCSTAGVVYLASTALAHPGASLAVLLVGRLVLGMGESLLITGVVTWAIVRAGPGRAGVAMSWNGMAQYGSLAAGAPLGLALYGAAGFGAVSLATIALPLVAAAFVLPLGPTPASGGERLPLRSVILRIWRPGTANDIQRWEYRLGSSLLNLHGCRSLARFQQTQEYTGQRRIFGV